MYLFAYIFMFVYTIFVILFKIICFLSENDLQKSVISYLLTWYFIHTWVWCAHPQRNWFWFFSLFVSSQNFCIGRELLTCDLCRTWCWTCQSVHTGFFGDFLAEDAFVSDHCIPFMRLIVVRFSVPCFVCDKKSNGFRLVEEFQNSLIWLCFILCPPPPPSSSDPNLSAKFWNRLLAILSGFFFWFFFLFFFLRSVARKKGVCYIQPCFFLIDLLFVVDVLLLAVKRTLSEPFAANLAVSVCKTHHPKSTVSQPSDQLSGTGWCLPGSVCMKSK